MSSKGGSFRTDINGLRALAVLAVIFYHFGIPGFGGGYVGVDVFYVISGFLMTQIICTKLGAGNFSLAGFYAARARRILPALAVLIATLALFGFFFMPPGDYARFGWEALSALTFVSNIVFSHGGGYFDTAAWEKWLLHTWSLSVEWQFYILLPLGLMGLKRLGGEKAMHRGIIAVFALSLLLSLIVTQRQPGEAFYLLPTRAWEMLAGGLVFLYGGRLAKLPRLNLAGLACILAAILLYSADLAFPGVWALLPVAGAALVIAAQRKNAALDNRAAQYLGTVSYSLYLWHWPVMVGARYFDAPFSAVHVGLLLALTFALSTLSYAFIEDPFRHGGKATRASLAAYALLTLFAFTVHAQAGLPARVPAAVLAAAQDAEALKMPKRGNCDVDYKKTSVPPACAFGADTAPTAVLWGDSHARALAYPLGQELIKAKRAALLYAYDGCPPVRGAIMANKWKKDQCRLITQATLDKTLADPHIRDVFFVSRWSLYLLGYNEKAGASPVVVFDKGERATPDTLPQRTQEYAAQMAETFCALTAHGKNVAVLAPVPEMGRNVTDALAKSRLIRHRDAQITLPLAAYEERNAAVLSALKSVARQCPIRILYPAPLLCKNGICDGLRDGEPLYSDDNHLNGFGGRVVEPLFKQALRPPPR